VLEKNALYANSFKKNEDVQLKLHLFEIYFYDNKTKEYINVFFSFKIAYH